MKLMDICTKKTYTKDGVEKATWQKVGTLRIVEEGKMFIDLAMFPTTSFYLFEQKPKNVAPKNAEPEWEQ